MNYDDKKFVLSVDPGLRFCGYTVFDSSGRIKLSETIKFNTKLSQCVRLQILYSTLAAVAEKYPPSDILTEYQFVDIMSSIVGVIMAFAGLHPEARFDKTVPMAWKKAVSGKGNIEEDKLKEIIVAKYPEAIDYDEHKIDTLGIYLAYKKKQEEPVDDIPKKSKRNNKKSNLGKGSIS